MKRSILSILAKDQVGTLIKVAAVISGRGLNIHEISAHADEIPGFTRITINFIGETEKVRLVCGQIEKLEVVKEVDIILDDEQDSAK
jgi:acetolactate synthase small subunit